MRTPAPLLATLLIAGCALQPSPPIETNASPTQGPARRYGSVVWETPAHDSSNARPIPLVRDLPLMPGDSLAVGLPGRVDLQGTLHGDPGGGFTLVFSSGVGVDLDDLQLYASTSSDGIHVGPTERLPLVERPIVASPAFVRVGQSAWLYVATGDSLQDAPEIWRSAFEGGRFFAPERMPGIPELTRVTGWPQWVVHGDRLVVSFRNRRSRPYWDMHVPELPAQPRQIEDIGAAYVRVVPMTGGGWLLSYQRPAEEKRFLTYVRISADGEEWSPAEPVSLPQPPDQANVHDAYALPRLDRGVDLYYSYPVSPEGERPRGFTLFRRAVLGPGRFGPEQRLTDPAHFHAYASSAHRLHDGSVLLTFSNILSGSGWVSEAQRHLVRLPDDAPLLPVAKSSTPWRCCPAPSAAANWAMRWPGLDGTLPRSPPNGRS